MELVPWCSIMVLDPSSSFLLILIAHSDPKQLQCWLFSVIPQTSSPYVRIWIFHVSGGQKSVAVMAGKSKSLPRTWKGKQDFLLVPFPLLYCGQAEEAMMLNCQTQFPSFIFALLSSLKTRWLLRETLLKAAYCFFFLTFLMTLKCYWETPDEIEKTFKSCFKYISSLFSYHTNISLMIQIYQCLQNLLCSEEKEWISEAYNQHFGKGREHRHIGLCLKLINFSEASFFFCIVQ